MERRNYVALLGGMLGVGGTVSTGAFTSATADRGATVGVANENQAFLALKQTSSENANVARPDAAAGNKLELDFNGSVADVTAAGPGKDSTYEFDKIFRIVNQGSEKVYIWINNFTISGTTGTTSKGQAVELEFYVGDRRGKVIQGPTGTSGNGTNYVVPLDVGEAANVGGRLTIPGGANFAEQVGSTTTHVDQSQPGSTQALGAGNGIFTPSP